MRDGNDSPMTVLGYSNGPGYRNGERPDFDEVDPQDPDYRQESAVGLWSATHSGEDVPVYAQGAGSAAIYGVFEQNAIFHAVVQAIVPMRETAERVAGEGAMPEWRRVTCAYREDSSKDC